MIKSFKLLFLFFFLLFNFNAVFAFPIIQPLHSQFEHDIYYKISPFNNFSHCIIVNAALKPNALGEYAIRLPDIKIIPRITHNGKPLEYNPTPDPQIIIVKVSDFNKIYVDYDVCINNPTQKIDFPILENNLIYIPLYTILVTPEKNISNISRIEVNLESLPQDLDLITSFNTNQRKYFLYESIKNFNNSMIASGKFNLKKFEIENKPIFIATTGEWSYFKKDPEFYLEKIITKQRAFWEDNDFPFYVMLLLKKNNSSDPDFFTGRHWSNACIALLIEGNDKLETLMPLISHESFHAWLGLKMKIPLPQGNLQWFFEGFNDFYGFLLAYESGVLSKETYLKIYNLVIKEYVLSPVQYATNADIEKFYYDQQHHNLTVQFRGHILAKQLRNKFKDKDPNPFDLAMKELFKHYQASKVKWLTEEQIDQVFSAHLGDITWNEFKQAIKTGEQINFAPNAFAPFAKLSMVKMKVPSFGFNTKDMLETKYITDVVEQSNAFKAGLRNGQKMLSYNINFKSIDTKVTINIEDNGEQKIIEFFPNVATKVIPQYQLIKKERYAKA